MNASIRRTVASLVGFAGLASLAGPVQGQQAARDDTRDSPLTELVVTAQRLPAPRLDFAGSITRVDADVVDLMGATHHAELLNRVAGVHIQRGSGQESLVAIRSPVLSGPGSCGAFLVLEDGMPIRPVGFCNVNELFEINHEQAGAVEIVRGPGPAVYGASAMHGIVNVVTPAARDLRPFAAAVEGGSHDYRRVKFQASTESVGEGLGVYGVFTEDNGFRADSGFEEAKLNVLADRKLGSGTLRLRAAGTLLNQETAGFIQGFDAYRDPVLRESNANPEAYRDAWSTRLSAQWSREPCEGCSDNLQAILRRSSMDFLQHFLLGKPLERNEQTSFAVSGAMARALSPRLSLHAGLDVEAAESELLEAQDGPTLEGTAMARAIRPAGRHYDYEVSSRTGGAFTALGWSPAERWRFGAALRLEYTHYDYDNRMIAGNTAENGTPCAFGGCLYSRPADREDSFTNLAPKLDASYALTERQRLYVAAGRGFRPPEMTELYRLQRQQSFADLDSERVDNVEIGWLGAAESFNWSLSAYSLEKRDVILRDANAFNVSNGRTSHRGFEYELRLLPFDRIDVSASGTVAWHRYEFSQAVEGGETIREGNTVDTAPRHVHHLAVGFDPTPALGVEAEISHVGEYFADAANANRYPGHTLVNARARYVLSPNWRATLRVTNLFDRRYADRADFAFGNYRYFPGRERSWFLEIAYAAE